MRRAYSSVLLVLAIAVAMVCLLPSRVHAQSDQVLNQRQIPICNPASSTPYLAYNVTDGKWHCATVQAVTKVVTGIADNTATDVLTVTVPNLASSAVVHVRIFGSLGAGGSIGAFECAATLEGNVGVTRTAGVLAVANAATATMTTNSCVSGASTITMSYAASSVSGGTTGTDTFTIRVTIARANSTRGDNHQAVVNAYVDNNTNADGKVLIQ